MRKSQVRFIRQQGYLGEKFPDGFYTALMLQPRVVGCVAAVGVLLQSPWLFLALSAVVVAYRRGLPPLGAALSPRRFAAGEAGTVALAVGLTLVAGATTTAWIVEAVLIGGVISAVFADFCLGAYTYYLLRRPSPSASGVLLKPSGERR